MPIVIDLLRDCVDMLAPPRCPACDLGAPERGFCAACAPLLEPTAGVFAPPGHVASVYLYAGPCADALRRVKAGRDQQLGVLSDAMIPAGRRYGGLVDVVTALPPDRSRLRVRGFDIAAALARAVAKAAGRPLWLGALRRVRDTPKQSALDARARAHNQRGAFTAPAPRPSARRILVVDDIRTTGATLDEAARQLRRAGYRDVFTLTLARTP